MAKEIPFETAMRKLEEITRSLEQGDLGLEDSLKQFDEAMKLVAQCSRQLEQARQKVQLITEKNGMLAATPFNRDKDSMDGAESLS
ncbi:MAG: exodeoxyribonuclease VII small subunit [Thermodesulfobacteriota bacterium]